MKTIILLFKCLIISDLFFILVLILFLCFIRFKKNNYTLNLLEIAVSKHINIRELQ
jgi:hypothetical protein